MVGDKQGNGEGYSIVNRRTFIASMLATATLDPERLLPPAPGSREDWPRIDRELAALSNRASTCRGVPQRVLLVSVSGDDITGDGTSARPYRTISKALEHGEWIFVEDGVYADNPLL